MPLGREVDAAYLYEASLRRWHTVAEPGGEALIVRFKTWQTARLLELGLILEEWEPPLRVPGLECVVQTALRCRAVVFVLHVHVQTKWGRLLGGHS